MAGDISDGEIRVDKREHSRRRVPKCYKPINSMYYIVHFCTENSREHHTDMQFIYGGKT